MNMKELSIEEKAKAYDKALGLLCISLYLFVWEFSINFEGEK